MYSSGGFDMPLYEVYVKGSGMIEADSADEARQIYMDLISSEVTEEFIYAEEVEE